MTVCSAGKINNFPLSDLKGRGYFCLWITEKQPNRAWNTYGFYYYYYYYHLFSFCSYIQNRGWFRGSSYNKSTSLQFSLLPPLWSLDGCCNSCWHFDIPGRKKTGMEKGMVPTSGNQRLSLTYIAVSLYLLPLWLKLCHRATFFWRAR